jgi:hypothetical protein
VDTEKSTVHFDIGPFEYDYLVLAMGGTTNFFGNKNNRQHAFTLKTTFQAITLRNHLMQTFENILSAGEADKKGLWNMAIVGAGPTGIELAGAFAEIKKNVLPLDFHQIDFSNLSIILIEGSPHTLNSSRWGYRGKLIDKTKTASGLVLDIVLRTKGLPRFKVIPKRWVIERTFSWLESYRRLSKSFKYLTETSETMIQIAMIRLMLFNFLVTQKLTYSINPERPL